VADNSGKNPSSGTQTTDKSPFSKPAMEKQEKSLDIYGDRDAPKR
jgi:hypothetical protein